MYIGMLQNRLRIAMNLIVSTVTPDGPKAFPLWMMSWCVAIMFSITLLLGAFQTLGPIGAAVAHVFAEATNPLLPHDPDGRINVLLLGVGDKTHTAANLTDSMIVASIDPSDSSVVLLSIPRDLYIEDAKNASPGRINSLYSSYLSVAKRQKKLSGSGASAFAMNAVAGDIGSRLGVDIQGVMKMDFTGFIDIVDAVGGVDIVVPETIVDHSYPLEEGVVGTFKIDKGPQHLNGETALEYARSRHSTTDFSRSARQQQILTALSDTVKADHLFTNVTFIRSLQKTLQKHFESTFKLDQQFALGSVLVSIKQDHILTFNLNYDHGGDLSDAEPGGFVRSPEPGEFSGAVLLPYSLTSTVSDWSQIQSFTQMIFSNRKVYFAHPTLLLSPSGASSVQVHRLQNELTRYGFSVSTLAAASVSPAVSSAARTFFSHLLAVSTQKDSTLTGSVLKMAVTHDYVFTPFVRLGTGAAL